MAAADPGLSFGDAYVYGLAFVGVALFAAVGALSHQRERAFSASIIYLGLGILASVVLQLLDIGWFDPLDDHDLLAKIAELGIIVALFGTGLKLDRALDSSVWGSVARLLLVVMPLSIAAVVAFGTGVMGLALGTAIILGATLAPTDPVLAGDVGVGPPGDEDEREPNFALTAEAGLNDGLAYPFVLLGAFVLTQGGSDWWLEWLAADVLYGIAVGVALGALGGWAIASAIVLLRNRDLLLPVLDGWIGIASVLLVYGLCEAAGGYGFLAAFCAGLAFRRYESDHEVNRGVHDGAEMVEKFAELALILLLGSVLTLDGLQVPGWDGWLLVALIVLVIRPAATMLAFVGSSIDTRERLFVAWFGVRGAGSLFYAAAALGLGVLTEQEASLLVWTTAACVLVSILAHGMSATPLGRRLV